METVAVVKGATSPQEGVCTACMRRVIDHVGKDGRWVGCSPQRRVGGLRMFLVPDRRKAPETPAAVATTTRKDNVPLAARVAYVALFPMEHPLVQSIISDRDRGIYRLLASSDSGFTRVEMLRALGTERTGIMDSALRRLRLRGLVERFRTEE